jgi:hypothetical protein
LNLVNVGSVDIAGSVERLSDAPHFACRRAVRTFFPAVFSILPCAKLSSVNTRFSTSFQCRGQMSFQLQLEGAFDALAVEGELSLKAAELRAKADDWQIGPIALDLPFSAAFAGRQKDSIGIPARHATIEKMVFGKQSFDPSDNGFAVE